MDEAAALSLIMLARPRASAKTSLGANQPFAAENDAPVKQQKQKCRRESTRDWASFTSPLLLKSQSPPYSVYLGFDTDPAFIGIGSICVAYEGAR
jgi:hypothetical protein